MAHSNEYIKDRTKFYLQSALEEGRLVHPDVEAANDGQHPETKRDLETPGSFHLEMIETWTLDLGLSEERKDEIDTIVREVIEDNLPVELQGYL